MKEFLLSEVCIMKSGGTPRRGVAGYYNGTIPWVKISDIENADKGIVHSTEELITQAGLNSINNRIFEKGTLLLAMYGSVGKVAIAGCQLSTNQAIIGLQPIDKKQLSIPFLKYWFISKKNFLLNQSQGVALKNISAAIVQRQKINLPSLLNQKKIVQILDAADSLRQKRKEQLKLLDDYLKSVFLEMFGDPVHGERWPRKPLKDVAAVYRGRFSPRPRNDPSYYNGDYPFIQTGDINNSEYRLSLYSQTLNQKGIKVSKCLPKGTIAIAIVGATIGATTILGIDAYAPDSVVGITVDQKKSSEFYIEYVLRFYKPIFVAQAPETARANINLETLRPLLLQIPPIELQTKFASIVEKVENTKQKMRESLQEMDNNFNALMQSYFG